MPARKPPVAPRTEDDEDDPVDLPKCYYDPPGRSHFFLFPRWLFWHMPQWIIFYVVFMPIILLTAIIMWIPWTLFSSCRPHTRDEYDQREETRERFDAVDYDDVHEAPDTLAKTFALPGRGYEARAMYRHKKKFRNEHGIALREKDDAFKRPNKPTAMTVIYRGWVRRSWGMYSMFREAYRTLHRQGLQVVGVLSALAIIFMQVWMVYDDLTAPAVQSFINAQVGGHDDPTGQLTSDPSCAYAVGTGVANWGAGLENIAWYGAYHGFLILLSIMLIVDETLNVRFGLFAPQWTRMGTGYTIMFLATATITGSQSWGMKRTVRSRYLILELIFCGGLYDVLVSYLALAGLAHHTDHDKTFRNCRFPLRLWKEADWQEHKHLHQWRHIEREDMWKLSSTQRAQQFIGDWCPQPIRIPEDKIYRIKDKRTKLWRDMTPIEKEEHDYVRQEEPWQEDEIEKFQGKVKRTFFHLFPVTWPEWTEKDCANYNAGTIYKGGKGADWFGLDYWDPFPPGQTYDRKDAASRTMAWWFDVRRIFAILCAIVMIGLHGFLLASEVGSGSFGSYRDQYDAALATFKANRGPDNTKCQFYQGTCLAIFAQPGNGSFAGVMSNEIWMILWHTFLLGMCIAIIFVAMSNSPIMGMHLAWPITLIGPRLSSSSIGFTLGFVAIATLQLGFFMNSPIQFELARSVCYISLICWLTFLFRNEEYDLKCVRKPLWRILSTWGIKHLNNEMWKRNLHTRPKRIDEVHRLDVEKRRKQLQ